MKLAQYRKSITALISGLIAWGVIVVASASSRITAAEWLTLATYIAIALGVYSIPNEGVK